MDLRFTDEERAFRQEVRDWIDANLPADTRERLAAGRTPTKQMQLDWQKKLNAKGWCVPHWPAEWGGQSDWSAIKRFILLEELQGTPAPIPLGFNCNMLGPVLIAFGTEEQKKFFLPKLANLDLWFCQGFSEPGAGSDLASLKTRAVREGDHYIVNGQKTWTTLAQYADWIFLLVRTNPEATKQQEGISFLLVDMNTPGITVKPIINLEYHDEFCEVFFDNVRVPAANLVGTPNRGWDMAKALLSFERIYLGSPRLSAYAFSRLKQLAERMGVWEDAVFQDTYAKLRLDLEDLKSLYGVFVDKVRRGETLGPDVSMLKVFQTELFQRITDTMLEICGENAGLLDPMEGNRNLNPTGLYIQARPATIYGGSNEIQRNIISKNVLALPG